MSHLNRSRVSRIQLGTMMAVAVAGVTALAPYASAINYIKADNGNNNLNDVPAWTNNSGLPGAGDLAVFDSTLAGPANYSFNLGGSDTSWLGLSITNPATSITFTAGNLLTLGASGITVTSTAGNVTIANNVALGASQTWTNPTGRTLTVSGTLDTGASGLTLTLNPLGTINVSGVVSGNATLIKNGTGTANFSSSAVNAGFTGNVTINSGTFQYANEQAFGTGSWTLNGGGGTLSGGTNNEFNGSMQVNGSSNFMVSGSTIQFHNTSLWTGSGTIGLNITSASNRFSFGTPISASSNQLSNFNGTIVLNSTQNANKAGLIFNGSNGLWGNPNMTIDAGASVISFQQGGTLTLGALRGGAASFLSGANGTLGAGAGYVLGSLTSSTFAGTVVNSVGGSTVPLSIYKVGNTTLTLSNTTVSPDPIRGNFNVLQGMVEIGTMSILNSNATSATPASAMIIGDTNSGATTLRYIGISAGSTGRLFTTNSNAVIDASGTGANATMNFTATGEIVPSQTGNSTLTLTGSNTGNNSFAPSLNNATSGAFISSLVKSGAGTWVLTGTGNGYTGATTITGGGLLLNVTTGGLTGTSSVTAGGTSFGGRGIVSGAVALNSGHLIPGIADANSGVGKLTLSGGLNMANGTVLDLEFIPGQNDQVDLAGSNLTLGTNISVTALQGGTNLGLAMLGTYNIFTNINTLGGLATNLSVSGADPVTNYVFAKIGSNIVLTLSEKGSSWSGLGGDNNWVNAGSTNWVGNATPISTASAIFGISGAQSNVNLNSDQTIGILSIDNGTHSTYNIASNNSSTLHLNAGTNNSFAQILHKSGSNQISAKISLDQNTTVSLTANTTLTLSGVVSASSASNALTISGPGVAVLSGNNSYASSTTVASGSSLIVGSGGASGTIGNGASALVNNGMVSFNRSDAYILSNPISGSGVWNQIGTGTLTLAPAGNYTFGSFTMTSGMVHAGSNNLTDTSINGADLEGDTSTISGSLTLTSGMVNTNNATINATITVTTGNFNFNNNNVGSSLTVDGGILDVLGHLDSFTSIAGAGGTIQNTGAASSLVLAMAAATNTTYAGTINGALSLVLKNPVPSASGGTLVLSQANNFTGKTIIGNLGETANGGGQIIVLSSGGLSNSEIDVFGHNNGAAVVLGDGVNLSNPFVLNTAQGAAEFIGVQTGGAGTYSGNVTVVNGSTSPTDIANSMLRLGPVNSGATITLTGYISNAQTNAAFGTVIMIHNGTTLLNNATINAGTSEVVLGRINSGSNSIILSGNATITGNVGAGKEGANMGAGQGGSGTTTNVILNDNSVIDIGAANFNLGGSSNANYVSNLTLNNNSILKVGAFTKTNGLVRIFGNGGTIVAKGAGANFLNTATTTLYASGAGAIFDSNGFDIGVGIPIIHDPNFGFDGGLIKNGLGTLTYAGNIVGSATNSQYNGLTTVNGGALFFGASGTNNAYTLSNLSDVSATGAGTLGVGTGSTLTATGAILTGGLTVNGTAIMAAANGSNGSKVNALTIGGTSTTATGWTGKLDITDNTLVVQTANTTSKFTAMASLANQIVSGNNGGQWNGNGIIASRLLQDTTATSTLALIDNADLGLSSLGGQSLDSNSILLLRAELGDADLSGTVDLIDFDVWFAHLGFNTPSFAAGDFNTDGVVDLLDFDIWFSHLGFSGPNLTAGGTGAVPEPASLAMLALGSAALLTRRRRKM